MTKLLVACSFAATLAVAFAAPAAIADDTPDERHVTSGPL
jgi:hypothetical protein